MATVSGSFTAFDQSSAVIAVALGEVLQIVIAGDFVGTCNMQMQIGGGSAWVDAGTFVIGSDTLSGQGVYRLRCSRYVSGTGTYLLTTLAAVIASVGVAKRITTIDADVTGANVITAQNIFPAAQDVFTTPGDTAYEFELFLSGSNGATTCTKALGFAGTATLTSIRYWTLAMHVAINNNSATQSMGHVDTAASTPFVATGTASWAVVAKGIIRVNAGGTLIPQLAFSADPTGTILFKKDSYMWLQPIGQGPVAAAGAWT